MYFVCYRSEKVSYRQTDCVLEMGCDEIEAGDEDKNYKECGKNCEKYVSYGDWFLGGEFLLSFGYKFMGKGEGV